MDANGPLYIAHKGLDPVSDQSGGLSAGRSLVSQPGFRQVSAAEDRLASGGGLIWAVAALVADAVCVVVAALIWCFPWWFFSVGR